MLSSSATAGATRADLPCFLVVGSGAGVLVVDRDMPTDTAQLRRGTPQARHIHVLLTGGLHVLEELLPGLTDELVGRGAPRGDSLGNTRVRFDGHRFRQGPSGLTLLSVSRPTLEAAIRARVAVRPGVRLLGGRDAVGLVTVDGGRRVVGVRTFPRADGSAEETLEAGLVIDPWTSSMSASATRRAASD